MGRIEKQNECALKLVNITKTYGSADFEVHALKNVSINFRKNEFVSILGHSGCGKTTLLNIVGGLDRYTTGDLIIEGKSTKNYNDKDWDAYRNNCIGFIFQSYNLIPHQTVLANVEIALELSGISKRERRNRALEILKKVGLSGQEKKKPNQLSGGQMQRVAIARALINDPEIILADEPTGALDTETSVQVMDLLKEIANDKLVIMVTHNPDLAAKYSNRIIRLSDGEVIDDTNAFTPERLVEPRKMRKPKMGFRTAFGLSIKNLASKKTRTILTSIAGSIGIIGVALVLALSNGFSAYMSRMQTDTLSSYPLTISESSIDLSTFSDIYDNNVKEKFPKLDNILVEKAFNNLTGMLKTNKLTDTSENGFVHYLEKMDKNWYYDVGYDYGFDMNNYFFTNINFNERRQFMAIGNLIQLIERMYSSQLEQAMGLSTSFVRQYIPTIREMPNSPELIGEQYDLLHGRMPENEREIIFVVDKYNGISDISLALLGYLSVKVNPTATDSKQLVTFEEKNSISLEEILGTEVYVANNDIMYSKYADGNYYLNNELKADNPELIKLKVCGILRPKENSNGILDEGFAYTTALSKAVKNKNNYSQIVKDMKDNAVVLVDEKVTIYEETPNGKREIKKLSAIELAGKTTPAMISIYAKDFESKEKVKAYIDTWNDTHSENEEEQITYSDMMSMMFGMLNTMVSAVTYVLVAFTSISLIVSSVMIGIITYISVVERTKEIGVLRALGASKREVGNVFNAETFLIGLFSGLIGVVVTYLLSILINLIMSTALPQVGAIALLNPFVAIALILVSIGLTLIAGLIPSRVAAKKDPVVALRTE